MSAVQTVELASEPFLDTTLYRFPHLQHIRGFAHGVTSKPWNMALHCGPDTQLTVLRRQQLCEYLGLPFERLIAADQVHSPHVIRVRESDAGAGRDTRESALHFVDGLICDLPKTPLIQFSADCPLILAVDPKQRVFGTAHAGWRGTLANIAGELIRQMARELQVDPANLLVGIAPCAGPCEFEVGEEVRRIAQSRLDHADQFFHQQDKLCFDLRAANVAQLCAAGVAPANIAVARASTMTDPRFYSHRLEGEKAGRFALIAGFSSL